MAFTLYKVQEPPETEGYISKSFRNDRKPNATQESSDKPLFLFKNPGYECESDERRTHPLLLAKKSNSVANKSSQFYGKTLEVQR